MNVLLASTSSLFGGKYLEYIKEEIAELFSGIDEIIFIIQRFYMPKKTLQSFANFIWLCHSNLGRNFGLIFTFFT